MPLWLTCLTISHLLVFSRLLLRDGFVHKDRHNFTDLEQAIIKYFNAFTLLTFYGAFSVFFLGSIYQGALDVEYFANFCIAATCLDEVIVLPDDMQRSVQGL